MKTAVRVTGIVFLLLTRLAHAQVRPINPTPPPIVDSLGKSVGNLYNTGVDSDYTLFDLGDGRTAAVPLTYMGFPLTASGLSYSSSNCTGTGYKDARNDPWNVEVQMGDAAHGGYGVLYYPKAVQPVTVMVNSFGFPGICQKLSTPVNSANQVLYTNVNLAKLFTPPFYLVTLPIPTFSPDPSTVYSGLVHVSLHTTTSGATIYYTTNGVAPTPSSTKYTGPIDVYQNVTLKTIAVSSVGYSQSPVASAFYGIHTAGVIITPVSGKYTAGLQVTLSCSDPAARIYYLSDNTTMPRLYTGPFSVISSRTIGAYAVSAGFEPSLVSAANYTIGP